MRWTVFYNILKNIAAISGIAAFITIAYNLYKDRSIKEAAELQSWREAVVYKIIADGGMNGLNPEEIVGKYRAEYASSDIKLENADLRASALNKILVALRAKNAITLRNDQTFAPLMYPKEDLRFDLLNGRVFDMSDKLLNSVSENPGKYTWKDLRLILENDKNASHAQILRAFAASSGYFRQDDNGKLIIPDLDIIMRPPAVSNTGAANP